MLIENVLYRAEAEATAGRDTHVVSSDGELDMTVTTPRELGGTNGRGVSPELLFAATYAASFLGMLRYVAADVGISLPADTLVVANVGVGKTPRGFGIEAELRIHLPGLARDDADCLVTKAHEVCPYSSAIRHDVSVRLVIA
jgi:osmotically inducible protein OsmC